MAPAANANVLLITGANSGVGYEAAKLFLESDKPVSKLMGKTLPMSKTTC